MQGQAEQAPHANSLCAPKAQISSQIWVWLTPSGSGTRRYFRPPEHERLAVSAISDRRPFDPVDIIKIIFHRVVGFEGLRTYLRNVWRT